MPSHPVLRAAACLALSSLAIAQFGANYKGEPIRYAETEADDAVSRLWAKIQAGETRLQRDDRLGYLPALLEALEIPASSQGLVFSKTSFQLQMISPSNPRGIYFNDDVYVGYVPGAPVLEITATDPELGPIFYTMSQRGDRPTVRRRTSECLTCHGAARTGSWPGHVVRSVFPDHAGHPMLSEGHFVTTHASPFDKRWGGWYVTGTHGAERHMGNGTISNGGSADELDREAGANLDDLREHIDVKRYPSPHSDIVALMVLEHQVEMHNRMARATYRTKRALYMQREKNRRNGDPEDHLDDNTRLEIRRAADDVVEYVLFRNEAHLRAPIRGTSTFAEEFARSGPRDSKGRSLRDLDLETRLFRYPCSYLIYAPAFDAMPERVRDLIYARMHRVLTGKLRHGWSLTKAQRTAILEILRETKKGLPDYFRQD